MKRYNPDPDAKEFVRFSLYPRIEHLFCMLTFFALTLTGLPQKFSDAGWASALIGLFGGLDMTRSIHRFCGWSMALLAVEHLGVAMFRIARGGPTSMVPHKKDFQDAIDYLRWCLGLNERPPRMGRFDYKQKFEYWGLLVGSAIMIFSGIVLIFPIQVASVVPGVVVAAAKVAHSTEAMLALLTVITWHAYGAIFSPEVFPIDKSIFTGKISRERMLHEHPVEFEQMYGHPAPDEPHAHHEAAPAPTASETPGEVKPATA